MLTLFSTALTLSAILLFWLQLIIAKLILPLLGGSPAVWNTCMVFFQIVLLLGYAYSHFTTTLGNPRQQRIIHLGVLLLPLPLLPIALFTPWPPPLVTNPIPWLLVVLTLSVGLPFFAISTTAPLLQTWFAHIGHPASEDPYFLYGASNLGSLLGLITYPLIVEPTLSLPHQRWLWTGGYGVLVILLISCALCKQLSVNSQPLQTAESSAPEEPLTAAQQARWVVLAFLPSSLLLGVTTYLTTDLAAVPLLWAVPLIIYLTTFILAFIRKPRFSYRLLVPLLPLLLATLMLLFLLRVIQPLWLVLPLHLLGLGLTALIWHGELAGSRPAPRHLTVFYFWIAVGGMMGGVFNAIAAPLLFSTVLEYPLILMVSLLLLLAPQFSDLHLAGLRLNLTLPLSLGVLVGGLLIGFQPGTPVQLILSLGLALVAVTLLRYAFLLRFLQSIVVIVMVVLLAQFSAQGQGMVLVSDRSFFGVYRVISSTQQGGYHSLLHGTTLHGKQSLDPSRRHEPLTYFSRTGPVGQLFTAFPASHFTHVGVLGLGVGTLAAYAKPGQQWTFYEIDPLAEKLAQNPDLFTFLQDAQAPLSIVLGDGRLALTQAPDQFYDLLFMDAFSSDSIPVHLITQEALQLYSRKLTDQGLLALNITNRYLDLGSILGTLAEQSGWVALEQQEAVVSEDERNRGKAPSHWIVLAHRPENFGALQHDPHWQPPSPNSHLSLWTDNFSNILQAIRWHS